MWHSSATSGAGAWQQYHVPGPAGCLADIWYQTCQALSQVMHIQYDCACVYMLDIPMPVTVIAVPPGRTSYLSDSTCGRPLHIRAPTAP